jgi:hypothetical protein
METFQVFFVPFSVLAASNSFLKYRDLEGLSRNILGQHWSCPFLHKVVFVLEII